MSNTCRGIESHEYESSVISSDGVSESELLLCSVGISLEIAARVTRSFHGPMKGAVPRLREPPKAARDVSRDTLAEL